MPGSVAAIVLFAACLHAGWNTVVKQGTHKLFDTALVAGGAGVIAACLLPLLPQPAPASWPFIAASVLAQTVYYGLIAAAYEAGDLSQVFPVMRGTAPLIVALASYPITGEALPPARWLGIALICGGVLGIGLSGRRHVGGRKAIAFALCNAVVIASYTLIDGLGVRRSGAPFAYGGWMFLLTAILFVCWVAWRHGAALRVYAGRNLRIGVIGGAGILTSYGLALWAMTRAPVAAVAALRESSILFALLLSAWLLRERIGPRRLLAGCCIAAGAAVIRMA